ncbi:hypothetical protein ACJX0J_030049, partial [Zea mays]
PPQETISISMFNDPSMSHDLEYEFVLDINHAFRGTMGTEEDIVSPTQTAFLPGRNIMEGSCLIEGHIEGTFSVSGISLLTRFFLVSRYTCYLSLKYPKKYRLAKGNVATDLKEKILSFFSHMGGLFWEDKQWNSLVALILDRNWNGPKNCVFCYYNESIQHLYFTEEPTGEA